MSATDTNFPLIFGVALAVNVVVTAQSSEWYQTMRRNASVGGGSALAAPAPPPPSAEEADAKRRWTALLRKYLVVYLCATAADWLQGPYVYALYAEYGYSQHDIAVLFVAGFASSMVFGSFVGGMADWGGRRAFVILFAAVYAASCFTKRTWVSVGVCVCLCVCVAYRAVKLSSSRVELSSLCFLSSVPRTLNKLIIFFPVWREYYVFNTDALKLTHTTRAPTRTANPRL